MAGDTNSGFDVFLRDVATGAVTRVSTTSTGTEGNGDSVVYGISADNQQVVFHSTSNNLVSGDTNSVTDVFVKNVTTGDITRVSTSSLGVEANGDSSPRAITADGRYVLFHSVATNLTAGDANGLVDVFLKDTLTGTTTIVSTSSSGVQGNGLSYARSISDDGRYAFFSSQASNLVIGDSNGAYDVFRKDLQTGELVAVSTSTSGTLGNGETIINDTSSDGRYVALRSSATNLVTGDTNGTQDGFIKDMTTGEMIRTTTSDSGAQLVGSSSVAAISDDGRYAVFWSEASGVTSGDSDTTRDVFVKDLINNTTTLVSRSTQGVKGGGGFDNRLSISSDGRLVTFTSASALLVSNDTNGTEDGFLVDLSRVGITSLAGLSVMNAASSRVSQVIVNRYQDEISRFLGEAGASSSRLSFLSTQLNSRKLEMDSASDRVTNADTALELSRLVVAQIRLESNTALAAQGFSSVKMMYDLLST